MRLRVIRILLPIHLPPLLTGSNENLYPDKEPAREKKIRCGGKGKAIVLLSPYFGGRKRETIIWAVGTTKNVMTMFM